MIFISKNDKNNNWHSKIESKEGESIVKAYLNFSFKKGCDPLPQDLNEYGSLAGDLFFRETNGTERKVFPIAKEWNGKKWVELRLLGKENEYHDPQPTYRPQTEAKWDYSDAKKTIYTDQVTEDDIPFL